MKHKCALMALGPSTQECLPLRLNPHLKALLSGASHRNFVKGKSNSLSYKVFQLIANSLGASQSLTFISLH